MNAANKKAPSAGTLEASDNAINLGIDYMSNAIKMQAVAQATQRSYDTPEDALVAQPIESLDQIRDALQCGLTRLDAQVMLMFAAAENDELTGSFLTNAIWLLQGQVEQLQKMVRATESGRVVA